MRTRIWLMMVYALLLWCAVSSAAEPTAAAIRAQVDALKERSNDKDPAVRSSVYRKMARLENQSAEIRKEIVAHLVTAYGTDGKNRHVLTLCLTRCFGADDFSPAAKQAIRKLVDRPQ